MTPAEKELLDALEKTQQAYVDLAYERAKQGDIFAVAKAVERSNEAGRRLDKMKLHRWIA